MSPLRGTGGAGAAKVSVTKSARIRDTGVTGAARGSDQLSA